MNQIYAETDVKRKDTPSTLGLRVLMILGVVLGLYLCLYGGVLSIVGLAVAVLMIYLFPRLNVEYEYVFVDGQLDFDRIMGKSKRKTMLRIDFEQVDIIAPKNSHALDSYNNIQCEKKDFTSRDKSRDYYIIVCNIQNKKVLVSFEPDERMLGMMKQKSPRKMSSI